MTDALVAFLRARCDETQEDAERGYLSAPEDPSYEGWDKKTVAGLPPLVARQILREVEAKRQLLDEHQDVNDGSCGTCIDGKWGYPTHGGSVPQSYPCRTLRLLALPYSDHPEYEEAWRS